MQNKWLTYLSASSFILLSHQALASSYGIQNNTQDYLVLTSTTAGGTPKGYCSENNGTPKNCYSTLAPGAIQWVNLKSSSSYIAFNYNACTNAPNGRCTGYQGKTNILVDHSGTSITMSDGPNYHIKPTKNALYLVTNNALNKENLGNTPLIVVFDNESSAVAHLDYYSTPDFTVSPAPDGDGNLPYLAKTTFTALNSSNTLSLQVGQYGAGSLLPTTPKCYYTFSLSQGTWTPTAASTTTTDYCSVTANGPNNYTVKLAWPPVPAVDYKGVTENALAVVSGMFKQKGTQLATVPNQLPLTQAQLDNFITAVQASPTSNGWALQFAYDSIRLPLWIGAYYEQNLTRLGSAEKQWMQTYLTQLSQFLLAKDNNRLCQNKDGNFSVNLNGFWAYPVAGVANDGDIVPPATCSTVPSLEGPLAIAAQAAKEKVLLAELVKTLGTYHVDDNTFAQYAAANGSQISQSTYSSSSSPYFNTSLLLISQGLLIGHGTLDISSANGSEDPRDFLSYSHFLANYHAWLNDGFVTAYNAPDPTDGTKTQPAMRVLYSTYNAIDYKNNDPANTLGNSPTVSEGMGYGLLIAYAANDQATFDKFLWYILSEAYYQGCAGLNTDNTACAIKSQYLMPWMVDEAGNPFNYAVAGGYLTSGSAFDADSQIVLALMLASERVANGKWASSQFDGMTYHQVAQAMTNEINRYEIHAGSTYFGKALPNKGELFTPGSQWGAPVDPIGNSGTISGTELIYPGYISPQSFDALNNAEKTK